MRVRRIIASATVLASLASAAPAEAYNSYWSSWRRWPWRNATSVRLTQVGGHSYASPSAEYAMDIGMRFATVQAVLPGIVHDAGNGGNAGTFLTVLGDDGTYYSYEHLDQTDSTIGSRVMLGDPIAVSGNSGFSTGPHLHLQRASGPSFQSSGLTLFPISGKQSASAGSWYLSDNAGIGRTSTNTTYGGVRLRYEAEGGYAGAGVPVAMSPTWMPCRSRGATATRWMYRCRNGFVQTFQLQDQWQAIMAIEGVAGAQIVPQAFLAAYTELYDGRDWVEYIGYPIDRAFRFGPTRLAQRYEDGWIIVDESNCKTTVYAPKTTVTYDSWC